MLRLVFRLIPEAGVSLSYLSSEPSFVPFKQDIVSVELATLLFRILPLRMLNPHNRPTAVSTPGKQDYHVHH